MYFLIVWELDARVHFIYCWTYLPSLSVRFDLFPLWLANFLCILWFQNVTTFTDVDNFHFKICPPPKKKNNRKPTIYRSKLVHCFYWIIAKLWINIEYLRSDFGFTWINWPSIVKVCIDTLLFNNKKKKHGRGEGIAYDTLCYYRTYGKVRQQVK